MLLIAYKESEMNPVEEEEAIIRFYVSKRFKKQATISVFSNSHKKT